MRIKSDNGNSSKTKKENSALESRLRGMNKVIDVMVYISSL